MAQQFGGALVAAIDALHDAQIYALRRGMQIIFNSEDVRALAVTALIQTWKGGR